VSHGARGHLAQALSAGRPAIPGIENRHVSGLLDLSDRAPFPLAAASLAQLCGRLDRNAHPVDQDLCSPVRTHQIRAQHPLDREALEAIASRPRLSLTQRG